MSLYPYIVMIRPINGVIAFISVVLGALISKESLDPYYRVIIIGVAAFLLLSAGNVLNDFCDVKTDIINKPLRPIPSGKISKKSALVFSIFLFILGTTLGLLVSLVAFAVAVLVSLILVLYTFKLRENPLIGNISIGILTGLTFISGGIAVESIKGSIIPAIYAFLFTTGREIVKDIQDVKGDKRSGMTSLAIELGEKKAVYISIIFFVLVIIASPIPYIFGIYSLYYLICVLIGVDLILIYCAFSLIKLPSPENAAKVASIMKFDIFIGLGAIYLGRIGL
ncbi:MAG: UbiA family prenyltransferase [bacterium]